MAIQWKKARQAVSDEGGSILKCGEATTRSKPSDEAWYCAGGWVKRKLLRWWYKLPGTGTDWWGPVATQEVATDRLRKLMASRRARLERDLNECRAGLVALRPTVAVRHDGTPAVILTPVEAEPAGLARTRRQRRGPATFHTGAEAAAIAAASDTLTIPLSDAEMESLDAALVAGVTLR